VHGVSPSYYIIIVSARQYQFHRGGTGDSGTIVTPFMQDGTYPSRNFATLGPSGVRPPFTKTYGDAVNMLPFITWHWAGVKLYTSCVNSQSPMFLRNSRHPVVIVALRRLLFLSYKTILPSSFSNRRSLPMHIRRVYRCQF